MTDKTHLTRFTVLSFLALFMLAACAAVVRDQTRVAYRDPDFDARALRAGGLSILPVTAGQGLEGYRRSLAEWMELHRQDAVPGGNVYGWRQSMERINEADLSEVYEDIIRGYNTTAIINRKKVRQLAAGLRTRYALLPLLRDFSETTRVRYSPFVGMETEKKANVSLQCLVIDLIAGDVVLEISGQVGSVANKYTVNRDYDTYARKLARAVLARLPGSAVSPKGR